MKLTKRIKARIGFRRHPPRIIHWLAIVSAGMGRDGTIYRRLSNDEVSEATAAILAEGQIGYFESIRFIESTP